MEVYCQLFVTSDLHQFSSEHLDTKNRLIDSISQKFCGLIKVFKKRLDQ